MNLDELVERYPILYHMAEDGTWPSIQRHGLLSTTALIDLFEVGDADRAAMLNGVRRRSMAITHPEHGTAVIRDQLPLRFLDSVLTPGTTPQQFLDALNSRVFFWVSTARLDRLLNARHYRSKAHTILHIDTASLVAAHGSTIQLAPYNTGSVHNPGAPRRGPEVFVDVIDYPFEQWRRKRGNSGEPVVELTVPHSVPRIADLMIKVERRDGGRSETLFIR